MKAVASVALVVLVLLGSSGVAAAAEPHPGVGVVFDVREFKDGADGGGLDDRFDGGPSFPACEIDNPATPSAQNLTILATDTCKTHTNGAPGPGLVPMSRTFAASAGESYLSWAYARVVNPKGQFVARVRLYARNASGVLRICRGGSSDIGTETADFMRLGTGVCTLPQGSTAVTVEFAAEARAGGASGRAVLNRIQLLRCASSAASCPTTVPTTAPPTTSPPPTTTPPPPADDGGGVADQPGTVDPSGGIPAGDVSGGDGTVVTDPGTGLAVETTTSAPSTSTTLEPGEALLRPIGGSKGSKGSDKALPLTMGLLTLVVLSGTAGAWWRWRR